MSQADRERELSAELQKRSGRAPQGFFVPLSVFHQPVEQRVITIGLPAGGPGSNIIATDLMAGQFIDRLGAKMRVRQLGARVISGLVGDVAIPRLKVSATSGWVAENAALSTSDMEVEQVSLKPKHAGAIVEFSRNMLQQSTPNIEQLVRDDFAAILAEAVDDVAIEDGGAKQPTGVTETVRIGNADIGVRRLEPPRRRRRLPPGGAGDMTATAVSSLPISLPPYGLTRPQAAEFVGLKLAKFDCEVKAGNLPQPVRFGRSVVWTTRTLQEALDKMSGHTAEAYREGGWKNVGKNALRR